MSSSGLSDSPRAAPQQQARPVLNRDIEEGTKRFYEMLAAKKPQSKPATSQSQSESKPRTVEGGLPPHLLRQREKTDRASQGSDNSASASGNAIEPMVPKQQQQTVSEGHPPHLLRQRETGNNASQTTGSLVPKVIIEPPASEESLRSQDRIVSQTRPIPSPKRPAPPQSPQPTQSRDKPLNSTSKQTHSPTSASWGPTKRIPFAETSNSIHPALKKAVGNRYSITVRQDTPPGSPLTPVWDDHPVDRAEDRIPTSYGIHDIKKWRPKHSEDLESQSLPSTAASVKFSDDNDSHFPDRSEDGKDDAVSKDVRADIADDLDIVPKGNGDGWVNKHAWKDYASSPRSNGGAEEDGFDSFGTGWKATYCRKWISSMSGYSPPVADSIGKWLDRHWECDVDTKNGFLMSPVDYPETRINPDDPLNKAELDRRLRGTADMQTTVNFLRMQKRMLKREKKEREYLARNPPPASWKRKASPQPQPSPAPVPKPVETPAVETIQKSSQGDVPETQVQVPSAQQAVGDDVDSRMVKIPCHLRPADPADAPQILDIYNWEVTYGTQALDVKPLVLQDIQRLLTECKAARMPFIVAVQGTPMEAACRKEVPAQPRGPYKQPRQTAPYQKTPETQSGSDKILGFGFISCLVAGLAGSMDSNAGRFIGRVHFYVAQASRRKGIGRAILHRLTRFCSRYCISVDWYEWYDPHRLAVFEEPDYNARNYSRLYIETSSTGEKDPDNGWYERFLDGMGYLFMSTLDKTRKVKYGPDGQWRDTIVWQHDCRDYKSIPEFN